VYYGSTVNEGERTMCNQTLVRERVEACLQVAEKVYKREFKRPSVIFKKRGATAGTANYARWQLNFNVTLLDENVDHFVKQTVAHEVAHLVCNVVYDGGKTHRVRGERTSPHGRNWASVMSVLGVPADTTHKYDVSNSAIKQKPRKKFSYHCTGCKRDLPMGAIRHKKQQSGRASYSHCSGFAIIFNG